MSELDAINAETLETIEKTLDVIEDTKVVVKNNPILLVGVGLVGLSVGAAIGFKVAVKRLEPKYAALAAEEIQEAKEFYAKFNKAEKFSTPADAVDELIPEEDQKDLVTAKAANAMKNYSSPATLIEVVEESVKTDDAGMVTEERREETTLTTGNVFVNNAPIDKNFDYEAAAEERSDDYPYPITEEEFFANEHEFSQLTATWYAGDLILADEEDRTIDDVEGNLGEKNLQMFGFGSKDRHMLYVRNHKRGVEYEVALSDGKYMKEVLGLDDEEDARPAQRRRRGGDE